VAERLVGGRYRLEERLGLGGMAEVWAAEDAELGRRVAIKLLGPTADAARFEREARAVAALGHPNICQVYDYGEADGRPFMVLEYLPGGTLEDRLARGTPLGDEETRRIASEIASALGHAHSRGLVHRDLKPANVLFDEEGRAKIADFGIARLRGAGTLTDAGTLLGTATYISPEQARGEPATPASDVYSFGVILYRMLAGRLPFEAASAMELAAMHVNADPPPLRELQAGAAPDLTAVAESAMAKDHSARPADGNALVALLGGDDTLSGAPTVIAPEEATLVMPPTPPGPPGPRRRAAPVPLIVAAVLLLAGAGVAVALLATRSSDGSSGQTTQPSTHHTRQQTTKPAVTPPPPATATTKRATTATTRRTTTTHPTTPPPPPPPPPPTTSPPPPTPPPPPPPTTVPTTVTLPTTVPTSPPPPPPPPPAP
jgi:eukaryotic-like serine/threonine-protein kinase